MSLTTLDREHSHTPTRVISLEVTDPDGEGRFFFFFFLRREIAPRIGLHTRQPAHRPTKHGHSERNGQVGSPERITATPCSSRRGDASDRTGLPGRSGSPRHHAYREGGALCCKDVPGMDGE